MVKYPADMRDKEPIDPANLARSNADFAARHRS
jgi:hypothetical protein